MFDPPPEMHARFDAALAEVRSKLGAKHALYINGQDVHAAAYRPKLSPANRKVVLGEFSQATAEHASAAMRAAQDAFPKWRALAVKDRVRMLRRVAQLIEERVYHIGAALALEVGKNRMEALGETQETADFFTVYSDDFEKRQGYIHELP